MSPSAERRNDSGAGRWYRVAGIEFPPWGLVRLSFLMNERRGWRRELAVKLHLAKSNLTRLLHKAAPPPGYENYLMMLVFLEEHGVKVVIHVLTETVKHKPF